jgi:hypothetical protein
MYSSSTLVQSEFATRLKGIRSTVDTVREDTWETLDAVLGVDRPTIDTAPAADKPKNETGIGLIPQASVSPRNSLGGRMLRRFTRFAAVFCIGAGSTLVWQSYGDDARAMIATSSPQLGWLAPQPEQTAQDAPAVAPAASSEVQQLGVSVMRQSLDQLALRLASAQQHMDEKISKLQTDQAELLQKLSAIAARAPAAPVRKPAPVTPPSSASTQSLNPQSPTPLTSR